MIMITRMQRISIHRSHLQDPADRPSFLRFGLPFTTTKPFAGWSRQATG